MFRKCVPLSIALACVVLSSCNGCEVQDIEDVPGSVVGRLCHMVTGRPSVGSTVTVSAERNGSQSTYAGVTDGDGHFDIAAIPPGTATITFSGEGVSSRMAEQVAIASSLVTEWTDPACLDPATLPGKGCISGQVCNRHTGAFVSDASVTVILANVGFSPDDLSLQTTTTAEGVFQLCDIPAGTHTVSVRGQGFQHAYPVTVTEGMTSEVTSGASCQPFNPMDHCRVQGRVCTSETPMGWLPDAKVTAQLLDGNNMPVMPVVREAQEEFTDADGRYEIFLQPQGRWRVTVQKGSFLSQTDVDCLANEVTQIPDGQQCVSVGECRFLAVQGTFDRVESVLERVGVPADRVDLVDGNPANLNDDWAFRTFGAPDSLAPYCGVFINCGIDEAAFNGPRANPTVINNLRTFVLQGGLLYASDQSYDVVEALFPAKVDWYRNDDLASDAEYGLDGLISASVVDDGLHAFLAGQTASPDTVSINFAYQSWAVLMDVDPDVQVFLRANVQACADGDACTGSVLLPDRPLTIRFPVGNAGGRVIFTSFHLETRSSNDGGAVVSTEDTDRVMRFLMTL